MLMSLLCTGQGSESLCEAETECGKCISASPDCAWCGDEVSLCVG